MTEATELLKAMRARLGLTQAEMASHLRVRQNTVSRYEAGSSDVSLEVLIRASCLVKDIPELSAEAQRQIEIRLSIASADDLELLPVDTSPVQPFEVTLAFMAAQLRNLQAAPGAVKILQIYRSTGNARDLWPAFAKAASYLEVEIARLQSLRKSHDSKAV